MRSQRLAKAAVISIYGPPEASADAIREVVEAHDHLLQTHQQLVEEGLLGRSPHSARSNAMLNEVGMSLGRFADLVARLEAGERTPDIAVDLTRFSEDFLPRMDALVSEFAATAETRLVRVRAVEYSLATLTIVLLMLEAIFIFAPLSRRLDKARRQSEHLMRRLEGDLADSLREVDHSRGARAVAVVASGVAHDLNNYIQVIVGNCELIEAGDKEGESVAAIRSAAGDASILCRQLLALNPNQRTSSELVQSVASIAQEVRPVVRSLLPENIALEVEIEEPSPYIRVDPQQARQAILNLCINARDASSTGGSIAIHAGTASDGRARISVRDFGTGIEPDQVDRIFEPFFTTKPSGRGFGLGLAAVRAIVERFGGSVRVHSVLGQGTTFELLFPQAPLLPAGGQKAADEPSQSALAVLYIEDNDLIRKTQTRTLAAAGHRVTAVSGASEAFAAAQKALFDLIVSDIVLEDGLGPEVLVKLRERLGPVPAILVTGYVDGWEEVLDERTEVLRKPYGAKELQEAILRVMKAGRR